jgi:hypothetical protein
MADGAVPGAADGTRGPNTLPTWGELLAADAEREAAKTRTRWSLEHIDKEACEERSKKIVLDVDSAYDPSLASMIKNKATILNVPKTFIERPIAPLTCITMRYTKASRWHTATDDGHTEVLNMTKTMGGDSGAGKTQAMRYHLSEFDKYCLVFSRDLVSRNCTQESMETRMVTNAHKEVKMGGGDAREGAAVISYDEGNKLVARDQYKSGKSDGRERWMECANGELVKTDRKGGATKVKRGEDLSSSPSTPSSPGQDEEGEVEEDEFESQLRTEKFWARLVAIMYAAPPFEHRKCPLQSMRPAHHMCRYTHPFRVVKWAWDEAENDGTDGWIARLKPVNVISERVPTLPRKMLMELADSKEMSMPLYHIYCAADLLCQLLPLAPSGCGFKLLELDDGAEEDLVK